MKMRRFLAATCAAVMCMTATGVTGVSSAVYVTANAESNSKTASTEVANSSSQNRMAISNSDYCSISMQATTAPSASLVFARSATNSTNVYKNEYPYRWSAPMTSYLYQNSSDDLVRVESIGDNVVVETFDYSGKLLDSKAIANELELFGGFYSGSSYNYLVFGQDNLAESNDREIMRIVKYSKDWNKLGSVSVKGANTYIPFDAGSLRMTETAGKLYIYTCHEMYDDTGEGVHHQANMIYVVDETSMTVVDSYYNVMNIAQAGYVSHSFNQFIQTDGSYIYRVDHGDAYPRGISIVRSKVGDSITRVSYTVPMYFQGAIGDNSTGAAIGGFELSGNNCIIAGNSVDHSADKVDFYGTRNVFVSVTSKDLSKTNVVWLTNYTESSSITVGDPQLVKISDSQFLVLWKEQNGSETPYLKMAAIDENGNLTSDICRSDMMLSDCQPILCSDGLVRWYVTCNSVMKIYSLNPNYLENIEVECKHTYTSKVTKEATCTEAGVRRYTCSKCGESYTEVIARTAHHCVGEYTKRPTCTEAGVIKYTCTGCSYSFTQAAQATGHRYVGLLTKSPTCIATGEWKYTCSNCGDTYTEEIARIDHSYSTLWTIDKAATCTEEGSKSHHCTVCGDKKDVTAIVKTAHSYTSKVTKAATCTATGTKTYTCSKCGDSYTEVIAKTAHNYSTSWTIDKAATCTAEGSKSHHCTVCGDKKDVTTIAKTAHSYTSAVTKAATCIATGVRTYTCSKCGDSYTEVIAKTAHNYSTSWTIDKAATCTAEGSKSHHCTVCGAKKDVTTIAKIAHNYTTSIVAPTPTQQGYTLHTCSVCKFSYKDNYTDYHAADISGDLVIKGTTVSDASVVMKNSAGQTVNATVKADGTFTFSQVKDGTYTVTASCKNCPSRDYTFTIKDEKAPGLNFELKLYGDLNGDGILTVFDVMPVNKCAQKTDTLVGYDFKVADVTNDNKLDVFDCMKINAHIKKTTLMW